MQRIAFCLKTPHNYMTSLDVVDLVTNELDRKHSFLGIFIDISKGFHTLDHKILISKLFHHVIRGIASNWFRSYNIS